MFNYKIYQTAQNPKSLVIFLHGYNGNLEDHQYAIDWIKNFLSSAYIVTPEAPEICDKNPLKKQWFGMLKYDPERKRSQPETSIKEIFDIYNHAQNEIDQRAYEINDFITFLQQKFSIDNNHTYLIGFSQGAMLTIYTALTRHSNIAGAFALSGLVAGKKLLSDKIASTPPLYMLHGKNDIKVQYKTLKNSLRWLKAHKIPTKSKTYANLDHHICKEEVVKISQIINQS